MSLVIAIVVGALCASRAFGSPITATAVLPSGVAFLLEVADDDDARRLGYMYRDAVGAHDGMLFLFSRDGHHPIWMKNCRVSLDIVWLDATMRVVDIAHEAQPCPASGRCPNLVPQRSSRYVIEFAGGTARRERLATGDLLVVLAEPPLESLESLE